MDELSLASTDAPDAGDVALVERELTAFNASRPTLRGFAWLPLLLLAATLACRRPALGDDRLPGVVLTQTIAAALVVAVPLLSPTLRRWGTARPLAWLGRISFGLYLVHMLVIASAGSAAYAALRPRWSHDAAAAAASALSLALSLLGGWALYRLADRPSVWFGRRIVDVLFAPSTASSPVAPGPTPFVQRRAA